jgi:internalin A
MSNGRIITFYSYKGGTGRTMALANVAWILAFNGSRVLTIDWDLEAPGLHRYFLPFLSDPELTQTQGVIDLVWRYADLVLTPRTEWPASVKEELSLADAQIDAVPLEFSFANSGGGIHFLGAGCQDVSYGTRVRTFDWTAFYERLGGGKFIEELGRRSRQQYDYILIDSRTGVADTSGVCTVQMPDVVVLCFTYNRQSVQGVEAVAKSIRAQRNDIPIFPVAMRAERAVKGYDEARAFALNRLRPLLSSAMSIDESERYWRASDMAYYPDYAFEETLTVFKDLPGQPNTLLAQMLWLAQTITANPERALILPELEQATRTKYLRRFALRDPRDAQLAEIRDLPPIEALNKLRQWILVESDYSDDPAWTIKLADAFDEASNRLRGDNLIEQADLAILDSINILRSASERGVLEAQIRLGSSLSKRATRLREQKRLDEALEASRESIRLYQRLVSTRAELFPHFAKSLEMCGSLLMTQGSLSEAELVLKQAVHVYEDITEHEIEAFAPFYASCLEMLASCYSKLRNYEEGMVAIRAAVKLREKMFEKNPEACETDYAASLLLLADHHSDLRQYERSMGILDRAEGIYARLALRELGKFDSELALIRSRKDNVRTALDQLNAERRTRQEIESEAVIESIRRIREAEENGKEELDLSDLALKQLPVELEGLRSLQQLNLRACNQLEDFSPLAKLTSLKQLNLSYCSQLGDLSPLARLTSLKQLNLSYCSQLRDLSPLANLASLQSLNLSSCDQLNDLSPLAGLISLQSLNLYWCDKLSGDLSPLAGLISLQSLYLSGCKQLSGDLSPLAGLISLQSLNLFECKQLSGDLSPLASLASLQSLDLSRCEQLSVDLSPLANLVSLQSINLSGCDQLGDLSPLASLASLQSLDVSGCKQLSKLSPLASLTSLRSLNLSLCTSVRNFAPLESHLAGLQKLYLYACQFDDLPSEICGHALYQNVIREVRAHFADLKSVPFRDAELTLYILGDSGVGKTQLCRRLLGFDFDSSVATTHGIQLGQMTIELEDFPQPVRLNLWDFGGQDIYHGSHALFLHGHAIFLILWTPELEWREKVGVMLRHRTLSYWLDYLRAFAGTDTSVLIVQSKCDTRDKQILHPPAPVDDFHFHRYTEVSARTGLNLGLIKENIKEAVRDRFDRFPPPPIGAGRLKVRDRLRQMLEEDQKREPAKRQHRSLDRTEFDRLCDEVGGVSDKEALLDFLHHNGVLFYRAGLFDNHIILDQNWALEAIYALFDRKKIMPLLRGYGRFTQAEVAALIWSDYTPAEQKVFLGMMESCGICFKARQLFEGEWEYIAPELLPDWSDAQAQLLGRLRDDLPGAEATARYAFLHEGVLRGYLSKLGEHAKDAAIYWKYGCWFFKKTTRSQVLIESQWEDTESESGAGTIRLRAWGDNAESLIDPLLETLQKLPIGQPPEIKRTKAIGAHATSLSSVSLVAQPSDIVPQDGSKQVDRPTQIKLEDLMFARDPFMKDFFISYAKTDQAWAEWIAWTLEKSGYSVTIQSWDSRPGANFVLEMQQATSTADRIIAVLSQKYLESNYTVSEWGAAFAQDPQGRKLKLVPIRVAPCQLTGILAPIIYLDLLGLPEEDARAALLGAFSTRNKPSMAPAFPGAIASYAPSIISSRPDYPGLSQTTSPPVTENLVSLVDNSSQSRSVARFSPLKRLELVRQLNAILPQQFNMLVVALNPEPGLIPFMPASQADRTTALVQWAEGPGGCGLPIMQEVLEAILRPS